MKNYFFLLFSLSILIASCKGDDDVSNKDDDDVSKSYNETDDKQALEDNAIEVLEAIQNFRNDSSLTEVEGFLKIITSEFEDDDNMITKQAKIALSFVEQASDLSENNLSINIYEETEPIYFEEKMSLEEEYKDLLGLHTWNANTNKFDHTDTNNNNIVVSVTSNNKTAILTISNFSTLIHAEGEELPKTISTELKIDDTDIMSMGHSLELDDNNELPSSIIQSVTFGTMSYNLDLDISDDNISFIESMSINDLNILSINSKIDGAYERVLADEYDEKISISTNTSLSLGKTTLSLKGETPDEIDEEISENTEKLVNLLNESISISVSTNNKKVADGKFFFEKETYTEKVYNYNTNEYDDVEFTEEIFDLIMIFEDGSKADIEAYFTVGFDDIEKHIEETLEAYSDFVE